MQVPLQITVRNLRFSSALDERIRRKAAMLDKYDPDIIRCRVTVEALSRHSRQGRPFGVRVDLHTPTREIVVTRQHDQDVYVALRDAFDAAKRQLQDLVHERRGELKIHRLPRAGEPSGTTPSRAGNLSPSETAANAISTAQAGRPRSLSGAGRRRVSAPSRNSQPRAGKRSA